MKGSNNLSKISICYDFLDYYFNSNIFEFSDESRNLFNKWQIYTDRKLDKFIKNLGQENFPEMSTRKARRRQAEELPKLSLKPPHTNFAVIPSRAITDPRINTRKPLLLLLHWESLHAKKS